VSPAAGRPGRANAVAISLLALMLLVLGLLVFLPSGASGVEKSAHSSRDSGRLAAFLLLEELGFEPRVWRSPPGDLPFGRHLLLLSEVPEEPPGYVRLDEEELVDEEGAPLTPPVGLVSARRRRDPQHYRNFAEEGGTLLVPFTERHLEFLVDVVELYELEDLAWFADDLDPPVVPAGRETELHLYTGEALQGNDWRRASGSFAPLPLDAALESLADDAAGRPIVLRAEVGRGAVIVVPGDGFLKNASLSDADRGLLLVRLVEEAAPGGQVLFDEYALGAWMPESPIELAFAPSAFRFTLHGLGLALLLIWAAAWSREFSRDPEPLSTVAPLSRAESQAGLLAAAGRWDLAGAQLRRGVLRRLAGREPLEDADGALIPRTVDSVLARLSSTAPRGDDPAAWRELLVGEPVRDEQALERLATELAHLERLAVRARPDSQST
jgi:hypothetical protein